MAWTSTPAEAQNGRSGGRPVVAVAAQSLPRAIEQLAIQASVSIGSAEPLPQVAAPAVKGDLRGALARLLAGTGLVARQVGPTAWRIERVRPGLLRARQPVLVTTPSPPVEDLPILVTATKRSVPLAQLPRAITVVQISASDGRGAGLDTDGVAAEMEGLATTALGSGRNRIFLRGVADSPFNGTSQSTVAVMFGDNRMTYAAPDPDLRLVDVDRVEVLKGPQGSLYGSGALGGIYRIVPNAPRADRVSARADAGLSLLDQGAVGGSASAMLNLPLVRDQAALRVVGYAIGEPGWIDSGTRNDSNSSRVVGARAALGIDVAGGWRMDLSGLVQFITTRDSQYVYAPGSRDRPAQAQEPHDNDLHLAALRVTGPIGGTKAVLVSSLSWHEVDDTFDATQGAQSFGLADPALFEDLRSYRVWDNELRLSGTVGRIGWLAGLSHVDAHETELRDLVPVSVAPSLVIDRGVTDIHDTGLFGDLDLPLLHRLSLDIGGRLTHVQVNASRITATTATSQSIGHWDASPSASVAWHPDDAGIVFLRYGSAFRPGGIGGDGSHRAESFAGDTVRTLELGWRRRLSNGGSIDLGPHVTWWSNVHSDMLLANGLIQTREAGDARAYGGELSLDWPFALNWRLALGGTLEEAYLVRNRLGVQLNDRRLPVIPEWTLRGVVERRFRAGHVEMQARAGMRYIGPARLSFDTKLDRPMGQVLESWIEADVELGRSQVRLRIDNLANGIGDTFAFGNPFRISQMQYTPQRPLSMSLAIARRF